MEVSCPASSTAIQGQVGVLLLGLLQLLATCRTTGAKAIGPDIGKSTLCVQAKLVGCWLSSVSKDIPTYVLARERGLVLTAGAGGEAANTH